VTREPVLAAHGVSKSFGTTAALSNVDFACYPGEVHALVGQNGAGKSTLMNLLAGVFAPSSGHLTLGGSRATFRHPVEARRAGIRVVYQTPDLVPHLNVAENLFLGEEPATRLGVLSQRRLYQDAARISSELELGLPLRAPVTSLSPSQQQLVTVARAMATRSDTIAAGARVLILDEPTAALSPGEAGHLFRLIKRLKERGTAIVYISHRLEEVLDIADTLSVLRDGRLVETVPREGVTRERLIRQMTGGDITERSRREHSHDKRPPLLRVRDLQAACLGPFALELLPGEILGVAGLVGSGRTELLRLIFGADRRSGGTVELNGTALPPRDPGAAIRAGMGYVTEDRQLDGLAPTLSVRTNLTMTRLRELRAERTIADELIARLHVRGRANQPVNELSGGNQQKVTFGKWLKEGLRVLLVDEPTQGVDVGAKDEIHQQLLTLAKTGVGILLVSSDFAELLLLSDRVVVLREGRQVRELEGAGLSEEAIVTTALG